MNINTGREFPFSNPPAGFHYDIYGHLVALPISANQYDNKDYKRSKESIYRK
jgi:hypothetical protein